MKRTLSLRRESLSPLDTGELALVVGGDHTFPECEVERTKLVVKLLLSPLPTDPCA